MEATAGRQAGMKAAHTTTDTGWVSNYMAAGRTGTNGAEAQLSASSVCSDEGNIWLTRTMFAAQPGACVACMVADWSASDLRSSPIVQSCKVLVHAFQRLRNFRLASQ